MCTERERTHQVVERVLRVAVPPEADESGGDDVNHQVHAELTVHAEVAEARVVPQDVPITQNPQQRAEDDEFKVLQCMAYCHWSEDTALNAAWTHGFIIHMHIQYWAAADNSNWDL